MPAHPLVTEYVDNLRRIATNTSSETEIFDQLGPFSAQLAQEKSWIEDRYYEPDTATGFSPFLLHEEDDHSLAVLVLSWVPGMGVVPHDHGTWAIIAGIEGIERNIRYKRLDDRSKPDHADLEVKEETRAGPGELVCIRTGGIHAVYNDSDKVALSLHTYGKHINHTNRQQYDLETNTSRDFKVEIY